MTNQPAADSDASPKADDAKPDNPPPSVGGDYIVIHGNLGPGSVAGHGSVNADYIVNGDLTINNGSLKEDRTDFARMMTKLKELIIEAYKAGELNEKVARKALSNLNETAALITSNPKPPKSQVLQKLQYIADVLDAAVDYLSSSGGVASVLLKALPIAALLIKIASRIF